MALKDASRSKLNSLDQFATKSNQGPIGAWTS